MFPERPGTPSRVTVERTGDRKLDEAEEERSPLEPVAAAEDPRHEIEHQHHLGDGRGKHQQREPEAPGSDERRHENGHLDEQRRQLEVVVERDDAVREPDRLQQCADQNPGDGDGDERRQPGHHRPSVALEAGHERDQDREHDRRPAGETP